LTDYVYGRLNRACIRLYVTPRIGHLPIQAVRPSTITRLYRDLLTGGGRTGKPLAVPTVTHLHAVLRKAFRDAVVVDELIASNPVERAKRPRAQAHEPGTGLDGRPAPHVPDRSQATPAVCVLPRRRLHRSTSGRGESRHPVLKPVSKEASSLPGRGL
jgi:hypothetical protein